MGCCPSTDALADHRDRLVQAEVETQRLSGLGPGEAELAKVSGLIAELRALRVFFVEDRNSKDVAELLQLQRVSDGLTAVLISWLDISLIQRGDFRRVEEILARARQLGSAVQNPAAPRFVEEKHRELQGSVATDIINRIGKTARALSPEQLPATLATVVALQSQLELFVDVVPRETADLLKRHLEFSKSVFTGHEILLDADPRAASAILEQARRFDSSCSTLAAKSGQTWLSLADELQQARKLHCAKVLPDKVSAAEAELEKNAGMNRVALAAAIADMDARWEPAGDSELEARVSAIAQAVEKRVTDAFDRALTDGATNRLDPLLEFAREYDTNSANLRRNGPLDAAAAPLARRLEGMAAGVSINMLLANARKNVAENTDSLRASKSDAEAKVKKVARDRYEIVEDAVWKYKLKRGTFKDFNRETCRQVEEKYQKWVGAGRPAGAKERRFEISIQVETPAPSLPSAVPSGRRERCKFGEKCFRKNPDHLREFSHPNDSDWAESNPNPEESVADGGAVSKKGTSSSRMERFSLDFHLMTQVNLDRKGGMRNIRRMEGRTVVQKLTDDYFNQVAEFMKGVEGMVSQAEREMRLLDDRERQAMQEQVGVLMQALRPLVQDFLSLAVLVRDTRAIDEIVARLGSHSEELGIAGLLKELRMGDVEEELRQAFAEASRRRSKNLAPVARWQLVRMLVKNGILKARLNVVKSVDEYWTLRRRQVQMRCQALLSEYEGDDDFCKRFRKAAEGILHVYLRKLAEQRGFLQASVVVNTLRTASSLGCDTAELLATSLDLVSGAVESAVRAQLQPLGRVTEQLEAGSEVAKAGHRPAALDESLAPVAAEVAGRAFAQMSSAGGGAPSSETSLTDIVRLRGKLGGAAASAFDVAFWELFQPWYASLGEEQSTAVEWAIAYCEQLRFDLPPWMMSKDQVEALRRLQAALESGDERALREAVIFAKQADCKADERLNNAYERSVDELRKLKRLPSGWEVTELIGDDAKEKMFGKLDLEDPMLKGLFQKIFDETKAEITTRDRKGAVPRGYRVERIQTVMNAESWGSYLKRRDEIAEQCTHFDGAAPYSDDVWDGWSGKVATGSDSCEELLSRCKYPPLSKGANEFLMFHGTKPDAADSIAENHFDMAFACKTGLFGAGLYFAEACSKSDEYVKPDAKDQYPMIIARVSLGRINYCASVDPITDPGRKALESSCIGGGYHSVIGDRKKVRGTYREFIVYDHYQVYPHFIVWYTRL
eukprot:TRINITY_DN22750_c0_g4_i1.p1 TRINITY_DN22750_c0_g4~~TRINITY_DN22750_c0_g4_i1.p1  ORF type:complete len:1241 (+),score=307.76 TRINITY_DN22750_c0_g4_i1:340-4062(+)